MKKILTVVPLAVLLCLSLACQNKADMAELQKLRAQAKLEEQNRSLVSRFFEAVNSGSAEKAQAAVEATFSPDVVTHMAAGEARGIDQVRTAFKYDYLTWSDFRYALDDVRCDGDVVVARGGFAGTQAGRILGMPPTGKRISYPLIYVFRVENGKIRDWWGDFDSLLSLMTQAGMELRPKQENK
jgi:predicted ester cyclase